MLLYQRTNTKEGHPEGTEMTEPDSADRYQLITPQTSSTVLKYHFQVLVLYSSISIYATLYFHSTTAQIVLLTALHLCDSFSYYTDSDY